MVVLYADLDNTLIYSHKHKIGSKKRCVELYEGREVSFITEKTGALLKKVTESAMFIPVTTRTPEQYARVQLGVGTPAYALACNGGVLLENGVENDAWYQESLISVKESGAEMERARAWLQDDADRDFELRFIRGLFLFTKSKRPQRSVSRLREYLDTDLVDVFSNGGKVYAVPRKLHKGAAIRRLEKKLFCAMQVDCTVAAGDSAFDLPMAGAADVMLVPEGLDIPQESPYIQHVIKMEAGRVFSEAALEFALKVMEENYVKF